MILVDTSAWIDHLRAAETPVARRLWNLIEEEVKKTMVADQVIHNIDA